MFEATGHSREVIGSGDGTGASLVLDGNADGDGAGADYAWLEHDGTTGNLEFASTGTVPHMVISTAGNVGIGTTAPDTKLDVRGNISAISDGGSPSIEGYGYGAQGGHFIGYLARGTLASPTQPQTGDVLASFQGRSTIVGAVWPGMMIYATENQTSTAQGTAVAFTTSPNGGVVTTERMRINHNGNVGIGTITPGSLLTVSSGRGQGKGIALVSTAANVPNISMFAGTASPDSGMLTFGDGTGWKFHFGRASDAGATKYLTLLDNGNVGIGTTSPAAKLTVANNIGDGTLDTYGEYQILLWDGGTALSSFGLGVKANNLVFKSGTSGAFAFHGGAGTSIATINSSGTYAASDRNLKQDITSLDYGLAAVMKLKPSSYHLKEDPTGPRHIGFIAQDVKGVVPEVVIGSEGQMQLAYPSLVPVLTKAIQELKADNDNLRAELEAIHAEIEGLKAAK